MKYTVTINIEGEPKLYDYLKGEIREQARSKLSVEKAENGVKVVIEAADAVAFRSCLNTVGQSMAVWEKL